MLPGLMALAAPLPCPLLLLLLQWELPLLSSVSFLPCLLGLTLPPRLLSASSPSPLSSLRELPLLLLLGLKLLEVGLELVWARERCR